ncbi:fluoride ion exporter CrcB/FEX [Caldalkalibacillus uzonensis]|uniref:Fluoride ion exporter CrcB/FEX n=1 Tax=Caldalkalibacillus uzonensis TaxID=353224 RepID=A0ABU0CTH2_9BACI|nr:fluoride ion exporter CrcB/FEX [Caldalkalibacillus uzonensis]
MASNKAALSRTERVTAWWLTKPFITSPTAGPKGVRPRVGLKPNTPHAFPPIPVAVLIVNLLGSFGLGSFLDRVGP